MSGAEIIPFPLRHLLPVIAARAPYPPEIIELGKTFDPVCSFTSASGFGCSRRPKPS
jgi:hypothetical protein